MSKIKCVVCDSVSFENIDGFYYCSICNTKSQNVCDIVLEDEETVHVGQQLNKKSNAKMKKKFEPEIEKSIDSNFSTFHILNILLKTQVDDLIIKGANPILKKVVLELWMKYLKKIGIAFLSPNNSNEINLTNIRVERDKKYFEIYKLKQECENGNASELGADCLDPSANDLVWPDFFKADIVGEKLIADETVKSGIDDDDDIHSDDSDQNDPENEEEEGDIKEESFDLEGSIVKNKTRIIALTKFEWIRMPHTICILNLALLTVKSDILVTDLIRYAFNGTLAYFNMNQILPESIEFLYPTDVLLFNATLAMPEAEMLRMLTSKLGQFLGLKIIETIALNRITSRFIIDLNLPSQFHGVVNLLVKKAQATRLMPSNNLNLEIGEYVNMEELALAHIYIAIVVLLKYDSTENNLHDTTTDIFFLQDWIQVMQNILSNYKKDLFGCDYLSVVTVNDLESLKYKSINHRHVLKTKPYISQFRRELIKSALKAPLTYCFTQSSPETNSTSSKHTHLLNILPKAVKSFRSYSIDIHVTEEKLKILGESYFRSKTFRNYATRNLQCNKTKSIYQVGIESSTCEWLLEMFQDMAMSGSTMPGLRVNMKMFSCVNQLLNKII